MAKIKTVKAREILDSRANPTIETDVVCSDGASGRAAVPSGASTGKYEVHELRDTARKRYGGKGVLKAAENVNRKIAPKIRGMSAQDQREIDRKLNEIDGTLSKSRLGANAILSVSLAVARAAATAENLPLYRYLRSLCVRRNRPLLPVPFMNIINGGAHADNNLDIQEFMIVPHGFATFSDALRGGVETFHSLKSLLKSKGLSTAVGDEGGFAPNLHTNEQAMELIVTAAEAAGYKPEKHLSLAIDTAASELLCDGKYAVGHKRLNSQQLAKLYEKWADNFPLISIEDPMDENDWDGWRALTERIGGRIQIVGDDLFATNKMRLERGIKLGAANAVLIKVNQIGTLSETFETMSVAQKAGLSLMVSHRSGETEDAAIADIAVAAGCGQIKTGAPCRGERTAKYNRLLRIEEQLGKKAAFAGGRLFGKV